MKTKFYWTIWAGLILITFAVVMFLLERFTSYSMSLPIFFISLITGCFELGYFFGASRRPILKDIYDIKEGQNFYIISIAPIKNGTSYSEYLIFFKTDRSYYAVNLSSTQFVDEPTLDQIYFKRNGKIYQSK